ncbi:hypothetical protein [Desulfobotulus mexicanus]|uniref:SGNH/GDSL hydrolase family protein n=1 Tax=Desulfobotulus mexicanus TaxID=2586642 RepID=A0A5S5MC87_9BACT|nr:hypothetical protein [Desulfobotulus mexicanus]TYT73322.1 hypothetical protein FIM25_15740 [Desulfobotulus mexicanus]
MTTLLESTAFDLMSKRKGLSCDGSPIHYLALGSSHGDYGFNPFWLGNAFNLCSVSQDLCLSFKLYEHILQNNEHYPRLEKLCHIILFFSVFSPGFNLLKSSEKTRYLAFCKVFGLNLPDDPDLHNLNEVKGFVPDKTPLLYDGFRRTNTRYFFSGDYIDKRAAGHLFYNKGKKELHWLDKILIMARKHGHKVLIVLSPAHPDYKERMPETSFLFDDVYRREADVLDLYSCTSFDSCFGDSDHLYPASQGPRLLAQKICLFYGGGGLILLTF